MIRIVRLDVWTAPCFDEILSQDETISLDIVERHDSQERAIERLGHADIYHISAARDEVPEHLQVTPELLARCPNLKCISTSGAGYDTVDIEACSNAGVLVVNQAGGNAQSVAEHAMALMLAIARRLPESRSLLCSRNKFTREDLMGNEICGKTLGLVGLGHIGTRVAKLAGAFDMRVVAFDPYLSQEQIASRAAIAVSLDELLATSDIVSVHCPRTPETLNMFNASRFQQMKPGSWFITTARGGIHDEGALYDALMTRHIGAAGLDVWTVEPPRVDHPLLTLHNVVPTYHTAGVTHEGRHNIAAIAAQQILQLCRGETPPRMINPEVFTDIARSFTR